MQTYYDNDNIIKKHPEGCVFVKMGKPGPLRGPGRCVLLNNRECSLASFCVVICLETVVLVNIFSDTEAVQIGVARAFNNEGFATAVLMRDAGNNNVLQCHLDIGASGIVERCGEGEGNMEVERNSDILAICVFERIEQQVPAWASND